MSEEIKVSESPVRDQIVDAALEVLRESGPARVRVQDVAKRAEVSATLLYYYFDGKNALIAAAYARDYALILEDDADMVQNAFVDAAGPDEFIANIEAAARDGFLNQDRRMRRIDAIAAAQHDPTVAAAIVEPQRALFNRLVEVINGCTARGWLPKNIDVKSRAMAWMALPMGLVQIDLHPGVEIETKDFLNLLFGPRPAVSASPTEA